MELILVASLATLWLQVAPPPVLQSDPAIAEERRRIVSNQHLSEARIFVAARSLQDGELVFNFVELRGLTREQFLKVFERRENFYEAPGVLGCIGDEYRIDLLWPGKRSESWFCPDCQRIFSDPESSIAFDVALSLKGARQLHRLMARITHVTVPKCAV